MSNVEQKKALRHRYLKRLYELSDGNELRLVACVEIGRALGWDDETSDKVTAYLKNEGLIDFPSVGRVCLTHKGVKWIEQAMSQPRRTPQPRAKPGFVTLHAEGDITIGGDVIGRDKQTKKKSES